MSYDDWKTTPPWLNGPEPEYCECEDCKQEGLLEDLTNCIECGKKICKECSDKQAGQCKDCAWAFLKRR